MKEEKVYFLEKSFWLLLSLSTTVVSFYVLIKVFFAALGGDHLGLFPSWLKKCKNGRVNWYIFVIKILAIIYL